MIRRPPRSTRTDTLFPDTTLFRSQVDGRVSPAARPVRHRDENLITDGVVTMHADSEVVRSGCTHGVVHLDLILASLAGVEIHVSSHQPLGVGRVEVVHPDPVVQWVVEGIPVVGRGERSEEHTSEVQSLMRISYAVFCLKKKQTTQ